MPVTVEVRGQAELRDAARDLRKERAQLRQRLVDATLHAVRPLEGLIKVGAPAFLPSGYAPVMVRTLKVTPSVRLSRGRRGVSLRVHAKGQKEQRDVEAVDLGMLRHPVFGNRRRWVEQGITPEFVTRPFAAMKPRIISELDDVLDGMRVRIERG